MSQIQPADPSARRKSILLIAIATVVGALLILTIESYRPDIEQWFLEEPQRIREKFNWTLIAFAILSIPLFLGAIYIWRIGQSVIESRRFPPPGMAVVIDTPIITGVKAVFRGRLLKFSSLLLAACAIFAPLALWLILRMLFGNA